MDQRLERCLEYQKEDAARGLLKSKGKLVSMVMPILAFTSRKPGER